MREFFWIDTEKAQEAQRRMGLSAFGLMGLICSYFYCDSPIPDDPAAVTAVANCTAEEWQELRARLLRENEIEIQHGVIVPIGSWHRPEKDG